MYDLADSVRFLGIPSLTISPLSIRFLAGTMGVMPIHSCEISFGLHSVLGLALKNSRCSRCRDDNFVVVAAVVVLRYMTS